MIVKKLVYIVIIVVATIALGAYGWFYFQRRVSLKVDVPSGTVAVLRINTATIFRKWLIHDRGKTRLKRRTGLEIPVNIFAYTQNVKDGFVARFNIKEPNVFQDWTQQDFDAIEQNACSIFKHKKCSIYLKQEAGFVQIYFPFSKVNDSMISRVFNVSTAVTPIAETVFAPIIDMDGDMIYCSGNNRGSITFNHQTIDISTVIDTAWIAEGYSPKTFVVPSQAQAYIISSTKVSDLISMDLFHFKDSLNDIVDYGWSATLLEGTHFMFKETVSYDYNDDFEKIEMIKKDTILVPQILYCIATKQNACSRLSSMGFVKEQKVKRDIFPLWQLFLNCSDKGIDISTDSTFHCHKGIEYTLTNDTIMKSVVRLSSIKDNKNWSFIRSYLQPFESVQASAQQVKGKTYFSMQIRMQNKDVFSLSSLAKSWL